MGRNLKYKTPEEQRLARNKRFLDHYYRNQEKMKKQRMERYWNGKKINT